MTKQARLVQEQCDVAVVDLATPDRTIVIIGPSNLYSIYVNTVLSAHACTIQDGSIAVITLPPSLAAGTTLEFSGVRFNTALIIEPHALATGNITLNYRDVNLGIPMFSSGIGVEAANGNVYQAWKGAVEPRFFSGGGNEYQAWKGAVEPGS